MKTDSPALVWTPRPPAEDEPACWSWEIPHLMGCDELKAAQAILNASLPIDEQRDLRAFDYHQPEGVRFDVFHDERCAICDHRTYLVDDHDHLTGQERGRLCRSCNALEGKSGHPLIVRYRLLHPAAILDYHQPYSGLGWRHGWSEVTHPRESQGRTPRPAAPWPHWRPGMPLIDPPRYEPEEDPWDNAFNRADFSKLMG